MGPAGGRMTVDVLQSQAKAVESEHAFLGAWLCGSPDAAVEADTLNVDDFVDPRCAALFTALASLRRRDVQPDPALALGELRNLGYARWWGSPSSIGPDLVRIGACACPGPSVPWHAALIREATARRRVQEASARLEQASAAASARRPAGAGR